MRHVELGWPNAFKVEKQEDDNEISLKKVLSEYSAVYEQGFGTVKNVKATLVLKPEATPKFLVRRPIPFALQASAE